MRNIRKPKDDNFDDYIDYYRRALCLNDEDFNIFKEYISKPLPHAFRIINSSYKREVKAEIDKYIDKIVFKTNIIDDVYIFYKNKDLDDYKEFITFLITVSELGYVQRQEIVSMVPTLLLGIKKGDYVFEPCAAPGSKTKQILEILDGSGLLISNDIVKSRINVLVTEARKRNTMNFGVTSCNATKYTKTYKGLEMVFDKICCDVPCSGDGTIRKNINVTSGWSYKKSSNLHKIQLDILREALIMLKKGGIVVYSTCSLNPVENEYVINQVVGNGCELIMNDDILNKHNIKYRRGITKFSCDDFVYENEELSKCYRFYPHDNDAGGFFIAIIRKTDSSKINNENINNSTFNNNKSRFREIAKVESDVYDENHKYFTSSETVKHIYAINRQIYSFIADHTNMKFITAGMRAFSLTKHLEEDKKIYMVKSMYLSHLEVDQTVELDYELFKSLIMNLSVEINNCDCDKGYLIARYNNHLFNGFYSGKKMMLFIDKELRSFYKIILK